MAFSSCAALAGDEIPKDQMTATASSEYRDGNYPAGNAIDNNTGTDWCNDTEGGTNEWLRIDLGSTLLVESLDYAAPDGWGVIRQYSIYVTDSTSTSVDDWGSPAASGEWPNNSERRSVTLSAPNVGRYVILFAETSWDAWIGANEVWVYGAPAGTRVTAFAVSDRTSGSDFFTDEAAIAVTLEGAPAPDQTLVGYQVTESDIEPTSGWLPEAPTTYTITGAEGEVALYGWVKDDVGGVGSASTSIIYYTAVPTISNVQTVSLAAPPSR